MHTHLLCVTVDAKLLCGLHPGSPHSGIFGFPSLPIPGGGEAESSVASLGAWMPLSGWNKAYLHLHVCVPIPLCFRLPRPTGFGVFSHFALM
jgi:hypothetical protein